MCVEIIFLGKVWSEFSDGRKQINQLFKLDYTRRARWPFRAFCVDGLPQITSYWCNYTKLAEVGIRQSKSVTDTQTDTRTDGQTDGRTNIKFWGPSTQKALKGNKILEKTRNHKLSEHFVIILLFKATEPVWWTLETLARHLYTAHFGE